MRTFLNLLLLCLFLLFSCKKTDIHFNEIVSNDAIELRSEIQQKGYIETITDSIIKQECFFDKWKEDIYELSQCPNVYSKLGGLAMPVNGWDWHKRALPATSDEIIFEQREYYLYTLECFGSERCMFESNFPVDKQSISYHVIWNAFKKLTKDLSEKEKQDLFYSTANKVYKL